MARKRIRSKSTHLVTQYLEMIPSEAFERYPEVLTSYVNRRHGIYALYRKDKLYYVGLASHLKHRLRQHLKDRHHDKWDHFSAYFTLESDHLKELESLVLRIVSPAGNRVKGKFRRAEKLNRKYRQALRKMSRDEVAYLSGQKRREPSEDLGSDGDGILAEYGLVQVRLKATFKGKKIRASVKRNGFIRIGAKSFPSPSAAARHVTKKATNGWYFWHYERAPGDWVRIREIRRR